MRFYNFILLFFFALITVEGQKIKSQGDALFFQYKYEQAIKEYSYEAKIKALTNKQNLNLADSYFKTGELKNALEIYLDLNKADSTMSGFHFNRLLSCMHKTSGEDKVRAFLESKKYMLSEEWLENANFNFELSNNTASAKLNYHIFNLEGNSPQADFSPTFYEKNRLLYTSSRNKFSKKVYEPSGESFLDIYVARIDNDGNIQNTNSFSGIPNSDFHEATPFYSNQLKKVFYVLSNAENGDLLFDDKGKNSLAMGSVNEDGKFDFVLKDLSTSFYYPFYEASSGKLYFAANFDDSYGGTDIYFVYTNKGRIMSAPVNLGPRINSSGNEIAPYIFENSLYFSSDVFYGNGGMDIYKSDFNTNDEEFSIPINLGTSINSDKDDFGFIIRNHSKEGLMGYFSSNRKGGKGNDDIYGFQVASKPGLKTLTLKGKVVNNYNGRGVPQVGLVVLDSNKKNIKEVYTNEYGKYHIEIPWQDNITLEAKRDRYSSYVRDFSKAELENFKDLALDIEVSFMDDVVESKEGQTMLKLKKFYFDTSRSEITPAVAAELDKAAEIIKKFPQFQLRVESHTNSKGGGSTNFRLSQARSNAIKNYLIDKGVPSTKIIYALGYGEDKLVNKCRNGVFCIESLHQQNERSSIVILNYNIL